LFMRKVMRCTFFAFATLALSALTCVAQTCYSSGDMDAATKTALEAAGRKYFDMVTHGDSAGLKQNAIPSLADSFSGIESAVKDNLTNLSGAQGTVRPGYELKVDGTAPMERAEFLCGVFNKNGQTANSAEFVISNLAPGSYAVVIADATGSKSPATVTFILQQMGTDWKVGGLYIKNGTVNGHDAKWFAEQAKAYKAKNQNHNAWFYYLEARDLTSPLSFMYTQASDSLYDEAATVKPADLPVAGSTVDLPGVGKTYKLTAAFPLAVGNDVALVVKYQVADVSDTAKTFQENTEVMKAVLAKFPEFRDGFDSLVARAVEPSGKDYGTMLPVKQIK